MSEIILARVDEALERKAYRFIRFIDDYKCYCTSREQAEAFIRDLEQELSSFLLSLNAKKVVIESLPVPFKSMWVNELAGRLPPRNEITERAIGNTLDLAVNLQATYREGSVVKYAARSLAGMLSEEAAPLFCRYLLQLAFHYPVVLPILCDVVRRFGVKLSEDDVATILMRQLTYRRSDMVCWTLSLMYLSDMTVPEEAALEIARSGDCMALASLLAIGQHKSRVIDFVMRLDSSQMYELDQYWILIHELGLMEELPDTSLAGYIETSGLKLLAKESVSFFATQVAGDSA